MNSTTASCPVRGGEIQGEGQQFQSPNTRQERGPWGGHAYGMSDKGRQKRQCQGIQGQEVSMEPREVSEPIRGSLTSEKEGSVGKG